MSTEIEKAEFNVSMSQKIANSFAEETEEVNINLSSKNWEVDKVKKHDKAIFLEVEIMEVPSAQNPNAIVELEAIKFITPDGSVWYKCAYQFVKACKNFKTGTMFSAEFLGTEKKGKGNAETFSVKLLVRKNV